MILSKIDREIRCLLTVCIMILCCSQTTLAQYRYYTLKGKNINVRKAPSTGEVIGKLSAPYNFWAEENNGWIGFWYENQEGYVSCRFVEELQLVDFSRKHLGSYMGASSPVYDDGYCLVTLEEKDGYVLMHIGDYSAVQDGGFRNQTHWTYAGLPDDNGVRFSYELYPYNKDMSVGDQITDETRSVNYFLVAGQDGNLYTNFRVLEPQDAEQDAEDMPLTERSLFMLRGNVSAVRHLRVYSDTFMQENDDAPIEDFAHIYYFSQEGDLTDIALYDGNMDQKTSYSFEREGDRIKMSDTMSSLPVNAEYTRKISNFCISYCGGEWTYGDVSSSVIDKTYCFDMKGRMHNHYFDDGCPPFLAMNELINYQYDTDSILPDHILFQFDLGGDIWSYQTDIKDVVTDAKGNWIERKAYVDGRLMFMERRSIKYYDDEQTTDTTDDNIYDQADQMAEYPGGTTACMAFIASNLRYPQLCRDAGIVGRVTLKFVVEKDGSIGEIKTTRSPDPLLEREAIRVIRMMPKWRPAYQNGKPVRTWFSIPVTFNLN